MGRERRILQECFIKITDCIKAGGGVVLGRGGGGKVPQKACP